MKVLVVDDDVLNLEVVKGYINYHFHDYTVFLCKDPKLVLETLKKENIDILLLDIIMPEIDGITILKEIRSKAEFDDLQIIMLTAMNDSKSFKTCFEIGASDYVRKPIDITEFQARLRAVAKNRSNTEMLRQMIELMKQKNIKLKNMNALLKETQFHLVQSEKMAAIGELAAGVAHEINTPIGYVGSNLDTLFKYLKKVNEYLVYTQKFLADMELKTEEEVLLNLLNTMKEKYKILKIEMITDDFENIIKESQEGIHRASEIIRYLLNLSVTNIEGNKDYCQLETVIEQVLLMIKHEADRVAKINFKKSFLPQIYCDAAQIGQVLLNILVNAIQAIKSQNREMLGLIEVNTYQENEYLCILITDNGPGIPEENLTKIFDPFFTTKDVGQGTGLGLSIAYDIIVNKHKGILDVRSKQGLETSFIVKLPVSAQ